MNLTAARFTVAPSTVAPFTVAMLAGGSSRRMGRNKATLPIGVGVDAVELGERVLVAALLAGAHEVIAIGGQATALEGQGWRHVPDRWPGEGPLGGIISALSTAAHPIVVVLACDLPDVDPDALTTLVQECIDHPQVLAAVPWRAGRPEVLHAAWRRTALEVLEARFADGGRSPGDVLRSLDPDLVVRVDVNEVSLRDLDTPDDLAAYLAEHADDGH